MLERRIPLFPNDDNFIHQIVAKIEPNRRFPFVQLRSLVEENMHHLKTSKPQRRSNGAKKSTEVFPLKCHICSKRFKFQAPLTKHIWFHHPEIEYKALGRSNSNPAKKSVPKNSTEPTFHLKCHICSKGFNIQAALTKHLQFHHPDVQKPFACSLCPESCNFYTAEERNLHLGTIHPDEFKLVKNRSKILARVKKHQCPHCPKKFISPTNLGRHITIHSEERAFSCEFCNSKFKHPRDLKTHYKWKHESENKIMKKCQDSIKTANFIYQELEWQEPKDIIKEELIIIKDEIEIKYEIPFIEEDPLEISQDDLNRFELEFCDIERFEEPL